MSFIEDMPKIDLHCHLDGGLRPQTVIEIAKIEGIELPAHDAAGIAPYLTVGDNCDSLVEYLKKFDLPLLCLQTAYAQRRVAKEAVEDAAAHNVRYIELRFAPQFMVQKGLTLCEVTENVIEGLKEGEAKTGTTARAILCCMRHQDKEKNIEVVKTAAQFLGRGVVGVDLAGDEAGYPPMLHRDVFLLAREYGIPITIHAGEAGGADNIKESIENLGAARIGHGIRLNEDEKVLEMVKEKGTALEICVTSNIETKAAASFSTHPIRKYFDKGLAVTVNTDNTTVSNTDITKEFNILSDKYGFTRVEMKKLVLNAAKAAFLDGPEKEKLKERILNDFKALGL